MACVTPGGAAYRRSRGRILIVCPKYLPYIGGVENHVAQVAPRLMQDGYSVEVLTLDDGRDLPEIDEIDGVRIRRVPAIRASGEGRFAPGLIGQIQSSRADLVHIHHFHAVVAPMALWAAQRASIPTVVTFHGGGQRHWLKLRRWPPKPSMLAPFVLDAARPLLRRAQGLIAVAQFELNDLSHRLGIPKERFTLIPNGCSIPPSSAGSRREDARASTLRLVSVGRLVDGKGHQKVLEAFAIILAQRPDATLWLAGDGPLKATLTARAASLGLSDKVRIEAIPADDRARYFRELSDQDVLVSMSQFEAHPLSVIEALAVGLRAVVAEDSAGLSELVAQGWAKGVPGHIAPSQLAGAILSAIDRSPVRNIQIPSWDNCADETKAVYAGILNNARKPMDLQISGDHLVEPIR